MVAVTSKLTWLMFLFNDLQKQFEATILLFDNHATLHTATNHMYHEHTKDIELNFQVVREKVQAGVIITN